MFIMGSVLQNCVKWEGFLIKNTRSLRTPVLLCSQYAQSFIEKSPILRII